MSQAKSKKEFEVFSLYGDFELERQKEVLDLIQKGWKVEFVYGGELSKVVMSKVKYSRKKPYEKH